jgi:hypothetical protein
MLDGILKTLLGHKPYAVRYCERDGSFCDSKGRAEELRARIERLRSEIGSAI